MSNNANQGNVDNQKDRNKSNQQIKKKPSEEVQRIDENNLKTIPREPETQEYIENHEVKRDTKKKESISK